MRFSEIPGQEEIKQRLIRTVHDQRVSHAQLFLGPEGSAKLALAIAYAQYINCENPAPTPTPTPNMGEGRRGGGDSCGVCPSCLKYQHLAHPDLHFIYPIATTEEVKKNPISKDFLPAWREFLIKYDYQVTLPEWYEAIGLEKKQGIINADDCHELIQTLQYKNFEAEYKVVIIWMVEKLFYAAAPKLLKTLEEPPDKTLFILVSENADQIIPTILSRLQIIKIPSINDEAIIRYLKAKYQCSDDEARRIALMALGSVKEAVNSLQQRDEQAQHYDMFKNWMKICYGTKTFADMVKFSAEVAAMGREKQKNFLQYGLRIIRASMLVSHGYSAGVKAEGDELESVNRFARFMTPATILALNEEFNKAIYHIERNLSASIVFTDLSLTITRLLKTTH